MARSIDPAVHAVRGFVPARTDEERFLMRHIEDLARTAQSRGIARYSGFLSDREQELARAALGHAGLEEGFRFDGGWPEAERRILCLEPEYSYPENPICCVQLQCRAQAGAALPAHKDYLGSLMGLEIRREALGDIVLPPDAPGTAYVFALEPAARLICQELLQAGRTELATRLLAPDEVPEFQKDEKADADKKAADEPAEPAAEEPVEDQAAVQQPEAEAPAQEPDTTGKETDSAADAEDDKAVESSEDFWEKDESQLKLDPPADAKPDGPDYDAFQGVKFSE